jgi:hypothetical protein
LIAFIAKRRISEGKADDWLVSQFKIGGPKEKRYRYFMGE